MRNCSLIVAALCLLTACGSKTTKTLDYLKSDDVYVAVDETFRPITDELIDLFGKKHPEAAMYPTYMSEDSVVRMLCADSVRMIIATRRLSDNEQAIVRTHNLKVRHDIIATDAFALITHKSNPDSLITLDEIKGIISGKITRWEQLSHGSKRGELKIVFDHSGSSTVRFMKDSLNGGKDLSGNIYAQGGNLAVISMVKDNPDIIGVVGTDWLKEAGSPALSSFRDLAVNVMCVSRESGVYANFVRPYQYYIATADYPLLRSVYAITTDPRTRSMTKNFFFFLKGQDGQKVICNGSQLLPYMPVQVRDVSIKKE
ncbi:MAG: substrate-binding domain-containing protein [Bacteroidales bacterium]|nr:substrate-binding domain-containing protein [Candidatus Equimonas enterica]